MDDHGRLGVRLLVIALAIQLVLGAAFVIWAVAGFPPFGGGDGGGGSGTTTPTQTVPAGPTRTAPYNPGTR